MILDYAEGVTSTLDSWKYNLPCSEKDKLPIVEMNFGGHWLEVLPEDYLIELSSGKCAICVAELSVDFWILGDAFLRGYYSVHDIDNLRMGFVPHAGSSKVAV